MAGVFRSFAEAGRGEVKRVEKGVRGPAMKAAAVPDLPEDDDDEREELPKIQKVADPNAPIENNELKGVHKALLKALADFKKIGIQVVPRSMLAGWLEVDPDGGSFLNTIGKLKNFGLVNTYDVQNEKGQKLTEEGAKQAPESDLIATPEGVFSRVRSIVSNPQKAMLDIFKEKYPNMITRDDLASALGVQISGSFIENLSGLNKKMMVECRFGNKNQITHIKLADWTIMATVVGA